MIKLLKSEITALQVINQNITNAENIPDNFGILPWNYEPGFFARLFGQFPFIIDSDYLTLISKTEEKLSYNQFESIECQKNIIHIKTIEGKDYYIKAGKKSSEISNLILRLARELNEYQSFMKVDKVVPQLGFAYFIKAFTYRGNPYVKAVEILFKTAVDNNFTDIHFEPIDNKIRVSYRLEGKLKNCFELTKDNYEHFLARTKYLSGCNSQVENKAQEGAFKYNNSDIRFSTFPTDFGERASFRIIGANKFTTLKSLGWSDEFIEKWFNFINNKKGLFLITGSVGSGKTTTLYATLSELISKSQGQLRAVSIEDPVEAFIKGICQSSFDPKIETSLASAFKHLLRQDPDIIALGEIRDVECVVEALQAGLSGHLVFATFHAGSPDEAIKRIKMMASGNELILSGLKGILHLELTYSDGKAYSNPIINELNN